LRGIPIGPDGNALHQSQIRVLWDQFYSGYVGNHKPTKEELLSYALEIDNLFGKDFIPPIR